MLGFPTLNVEKFITESLNEAAINNTSPLIHQYARSEGHPRLVQSLSKFFSPKLSRTIDPLSEIVVTVGATEAIYSTVQAFVSPGDKVLLMQPYYDSYPASILLAGGVPVLTSLKPKNLSATSAEDWELDFSELRKILETNKIKMLFLNNPHNPIGKVFKKSELLKIAAFAKEFDFLVVADEVYETLVYSDNSEPFVKFASLPDMFERTITIGSVGKMFGVTGWKIGWCISSPEIIKSIQLVHQFVPFSVTTPIQEAVAICLEKTEKNNFFSSNLNKYENLRDKLFNNLKEVGLSPMLPQGGYFILANTSSVTGFESGDKRGRDYDVCKYLTEKCGVTAIPPAAFYDEKFTGDSERKKTAGYLARFAFCKSRDMLDEANIRLKNYFNKKL
ncbi:Kynurenine--oxoglutarate transaminase 3 [Clydaea vesicula]|uniref:Kynurenine--oxoglutarate transaminase 3 n=1 Tax=Clydaea vesicula TaxID=447962 RepID=A0AAD5TUD7_9FUNG|nr:Kynurenine--oxoglutarate transaminase 3 [Clydaea vesicula]